MLQPDSSAQVQIFSDKGAVAREAADLFTQIALDSVAKRGRFLVALSGGSTPKAMYSLLADAPYASTVPWSSTHVFWGDERLVPPDDPGSNYYHASKLLLEHVPIPGKNIHRVKGEQPAEETMQDMVDHLGNLASADRQWPRLDLIMLGMGSDGHTASLFPGSKSVEDPGVIVKIVTAEYEDRPSNRLTMTPLIINDARQILFLVTGANKAEALATVLRGPQNWEKWPAQRIQPHDGTLTWFIDREAAGK